MTTHSSPAAAGLEVQNFEPSRQDFLHDVLDGLQREDKLLHCKHLYDETGSQLFDEICKLEEYYPTRTEIAIMEVNADAMAERLGERCLLIEYGSGSSIKTRLLLQKLKNPAAYVPLDISLEHLTKSAEALAAVFPGLAVLPVCADYTSDFELPEPPGGRESVGRRVVYFPGSTIGNFHKDAAKAFLKHVADVVEKDGGLLIGVDLEKDVATMEAAYNDARGVTAAFNLNLLHRINRELHADFDLDGFEFRATWNEAENRIESHLISTRQQSVRITGVPVAFDEGERIRTECSYKYTLEAFAELAAEAGFHVDEVWTDDNNYFSVQYLTVRS